MTGTSLTPPVVIPLTETCMNNLSDDKMVLAARQKTYKHKMRVSEGRSRRSGSRPGGLMGPWIAVRKQQKNNNGSMLSGYNQMKSIYIQL